MQNFNWNMIGVIVGAMSTCTLFIRWFIRSIIREENAVQLGQINGTYVRSAGATVTGAEIERRLNILEDDIIDLRYTVEHFGT